MTLASWICFVFCCAANRRAAFLDQSDIALSSDLPGLRINVALPPIGSAAFGAKSAIDARGSGALDVQPRVLFVKGEPSDFFVLDVVKGSNDF
jgi:hypothetical protein